LPTYEMWGYVAIYTPQIPRYRVNITSPKVKSLKGIILGILLGIVDVLVLPRDRNTMCILRMVISHYV